MTSRSDARHRASVRPTGPLSLLTTAVTTAVSDQVGNVGRGGVVIAMSSGLVATIGLPAHANGRSVAPEAAPATAPIAVRPAVAFSGGVIAAGADVLTAAAPITAPAAATISFENRAFTAVPTMAQPSPSDSRADSRAGYPSASFGSARGSSAVSVASRYLGVPYRFGGTTPIGWDCSGAVAYIFRQLGVALPRTANQQLLATHRVSRSEARPGDLVFMLSGGSAYHVGIYAGNNTMYDAQRSGRRFTKREIFTASVVFGRLG